MRRSVLHVHFIVSPASSHATGRTHLKALLVPCVLKVSVCLKWTLFSLHLLLEGSNETQQKIIARWLANPSRAHIHFPNESQSLYDIFTSLSKEKIFKLLYDHVGVLDYVDGCIYKWLVNFERWIHTQSFTTQI